MKKFTFLSMLLTYVLAATLLAGCSQSTNPTTIDQPKPTQSSVVENSSTTPPVEHEAGTSKPTSTDVNDFLQPDGTFDLIGYCEAHGFKVTVCKIEDGNIGAPGPPNPIWFYDLVLYRDDSQKPSINFSGPNSTIPYTIISATHAEGDMRIRYESIIYPSKDLFEVQYMIPPYRKSQEITEIIEAVSGRYVPIISECEPEILLPTDNVPIVLGVLERFLTDPTENPFLGMEYGAYTENIYQVVNGEWINENGDTKSVHNSNDVIFLP